jgi:hypothetical protein
LASAADRGLDVMRRFSRSGMQLAANTMMQSDIVTRVSCVLILESRQTDIHEWYFFGCASDLCLII